MKKFLERERVFMRILKMIAFFGRRPYFNGVTKFLTTQSASLNLALNKPEATASPKELAERWQQLMPPDAQELFPIKFSDERTAFTEIHVHCPLRGTGDVQACHRLMNYDRKLMEALGGELIVLESQSNSGKSYCSIAIRREGEDTRDLVPAHKA
jgi:hypothetical protein